MKRLTGFTMLTAAGMSTAVSLLMLFAAGVCPALAVSFICLFIASVMTWVPVREENGYLFAFIAYAVTSIVALLICPSVYTYLYVLLFGHYGIVYYFLRRRVQDDVLRWLLMFLYCNVMIAAGLALAQYAFGYDVQTMAPGFPVWALILLIEASLAVYGVLYHFCCDLFDTHARKVILPRR